MPREKKGCAPQCIKTKRAEGNQAIETLGTGLKEDSRRRQKTHIVVLHLRDKATAAGPLFQLRQRDAQISADLLRGEIQRFGSGAQLAARVIAELFCFRSHQVTFLIAATKADWGNAANLSPSS